MLFTPKIAAGSLKGITRDTVIRIAEELNISIVETDITRYDTWIADEMFLTGTAAEIIPIVEVDSRSIGVGRPGAITARFIEVFKCMCFQGGHETLKLFCSWGFEESLSRPIVPCKRSS